VTRRWARGRLFDHAAAVMLYEPCVEQPTATVLKVWFRCSINMPALLQLFMICLSRAQTAASHCAQGLAHHWQSP